MKHSPNAPCPCHSGKKYKKCCKIYHDKKAFAKDAALLMRSRYSAFALHKVDYIIQTTHPSNQEYTSDVESWRQSIASFSAQTNFDGLQIINSTQNSHEAKVTFFAKLSVAGQDASFTEESDFLKENEKWYYLGGIVR